MLSIKTPHSTGINTAATLPALADELHKLISRNLTPHEVIALSKTNKHFAHLCNHNALWSRYLKADVKLNMKEHGAAKELFKEPNNRLDHWVPTDKHGRVYLRRLNPSFGKLFGAATMRCIQNKLLTVDQFAGMNMEAMINLSKIEKALTQGVITIEEFLRNSTHRNFTRFFGSNAMELILSKRLTLLEVTELPDHSFSLLVQRDNVFS